MIDSQFGIILVSSYKYGNVWLKRSDFLDYSISYMPEYEGKTDLGSVDEKCGLCTAKYECCERLLVWHTGVSGIHWGNRTLDYKECHSKKWGKGLFLACPVWAFEPIEWIVKHGKSTRQAFKHRAYCVLCSVKSKCT